MFDKFTDRARKVMSLARQEAQKFNHEYIGTEHILLGIVHEDTGIAAKVLKNLGADLRKIRMEVEKLIPQGPPMVTMGQLPFTPRGKRVLELAREESDGLGHDYIGTEHLLLGLLRESEGIAGQVLMNLNLRLDDVREEVLEVLAGNPSSPGDVGEEAEDPQTQRDKSEVDELLRAVGGHEIDLGGRRPRHRAEQRYRTTPRVRKILTLANEEARSLGHDYIDFEHLLLAMIRESEGAANLLLSALNTNKDKLREELLTSLRKEPPSRRTEPASQDDVYGATLRAFLRAMRGQPAGEFGLARGPVRAALARAREEAKRLNHAHVGTGHLLVGLAAQEDGLAARALKNLGVTPEMIQAAMVEFIAPAPPLAAEGTITISPRMLEVIRLAHEETNKASLIHPDTEHLLLALLRESRGFAAQILAKLGLAPDQIRAEVDRLAGRPSDAGPLPPEAGGKPAG